MVLVPLEMYAACTCVETAALAIPMLRWTLLMAVSGIILLPSIPKVLATTKGTTSWLTTSPLPGKILAITEEKRGE